MLSKFTAQHELCDSDKRESKRELGNLVQWTTADDKIFVPASHTRPGLVPGVFEIQHSPSIGLYFHRIPVKTEGLIRFPQTNSERVVREIQNFWEKENIFREFHLAYKRGIILWGPPGSGKSSTIQLIMKDVVDRHGVVIKFTNPGLFMEGMRIFREIEFKTPIVILMEDIDSILEVFSESDVLNILDGVDQIEKAVFLACPSPDHLILKSNLTWVRADSLSPGDELIAFDDELKEGKGRKFRTSLVNSCPIVQKPRYKVTTSEGVVVVSEHHPFLVKLGNRPHKWRKVEDLRPGNRIVCVGRPWQIDETREGGYLAGQYDGEGTLNITYKEESGSHGFRVNWVQAVGSVAQYVESLLRQRGYNVAVYTSQPKGKGKHGKYKKKVSLNIRGGRWENLKLLGSLRPLRLLSHPRLQDAWQGCTLHTTEYSRVVAVEPIGVGPVVALDTTTKTFIGEGMLQHNTTNYPERLGARILNRPSRFDKRFKIDHPNAESRMLYFKHLLGTRVPKDLNVNLEKWVKDTDKFSIAHLKELFVAVVILGDDYAEAIETLESMKEVISSEDDRDKMMGFGTCKSLATTFDLLF